MFISSEMLADSTKSGIKALITIQIKNFKKPVAAFSVWVHIYSKLPSIQIFPESHLSSDGLTQNSDPLLAWNLIEISI